MLFRSAEFIRSLVSGLVSIYADDSRLELDMDLADVSLDITQAVPCGLIVNELVSNALIHGLPGVGAPSLLVSLRNNGSSIALCVRDNGVGLPDNLEPTERLPWGFTSSTYSQNNSKERFIPRMVLAQPL